MSLHNHQSEMVEIHFKLELVRLNHANRLFSDPTLISIGIMTVVHVLFIANFKRRYFKLREFQSTRQL